MRASVKTVRQSIQELLESSKDTVDCAILLPVIESLFQELDINENTNEQAYRQLVIDITSLLLSSRVLTTTGIKQFEWLSRFAEAGHDINALQALVKSLEPTLFHALSETQVSQQPLEPGIETEQAETPINFAQLPAALSQKFNSQLPDSLEENHYNDAEIKSLKVTLQSRLDSTKTQCKEFEGLMQLLLTDLRQANNESELETIRSMLKSSISRLLEEQHTISSNIIDVANELDRFETHCEQLNHELGLVKRLSMTDELTRLPNRRAFLKRLQNESGRVQRYGYPLSVAILDLDLFKEINDNYGHAIGDEVLLNYTKNVLSTFRNYDLVARYGGEEFAVILPHTDIYGAERALNKVLQKSAETQFSPTHKDQPIKLPSFSAGIAVYKEGEPIEAVINRADKAMYNAKKMGRSRVVVEPA